MKKKVWILNHYATEMYADRGGRHYWFAKNLMKAGYEPTVFCANTFHNNTTDIIDTGDSRFKVSEVDQIPFVFVKTTVASGNGLDRVKNMALFYRNLFPVARQYANEHGKPDVILASSVHPLTMVAGIQIAKKMKIPCVCEIRDLWPEAIFAFNKARETSLLGKTLVAGEHWIYRNADALIFTKEGDTDYIREQQWDTAHGGDIDLKKAHYINNGVDLEAFQRSIEENTLEDEDLASGKFNVIYVGALRPVNNVGNILDAAKLLKDHDEIQFLIYGDGIQKEMLNQRVAEESLSNVVMKGFVNKQYIPYILNKSSVNILNYSNTQYNWTRGNSSNKLFEYMASGKPIISTIKMSYSIIDRYKCGIELANGSPEEIARAILILKDMSEEQYRVLGDNAKHGAEDFDFKVLTNKLMDVLSSVDPNVE